MHSFGVDGIAVRDHRLVGEGSSFPVVAESSVHRVLDRSDLLFQIGDVHFYLEVLSIGCDGRLWRNLLCLLVIQVDGAVSQVGLKSVRLSRIDFAGDHVCPLFRNCFPFRQPNTDLGWD